MITCLVDGMTRTRIIDCVSTCSLKNFESSSEPSRRTVNAPCCWGVGFSDASGLNSEGSDEGDGMAIGLLIASYAVTTAGRKYAKPPDEAASATATTARTRVRIGFRRLREALARRPGRKPSTGVHSSPGAVQCCKRFVKAPHGVFVAKTALRSGWRRGFGAKREPWLAGDRQLYGAHHEHQDREHEITAESDDCYPPHGRPLRPLQEDHGRHSPVHALFARHHGPAGKTLL